MIFQKDVVLTPADSKTNVHIPFNVESGCVMMKIKYSYAPKKVESLLLSLQLVKENISRDAPGFESEYPDVKSFLPLLNLVTLSLSSPTEYRGAAHRQSDNQIHVISENFASVGFVKGKIDEGEWTLTLNVHSLITDKCNCHIEIETIKDTEEKHLFPCELHCHTVHSDGSFTVRELLNTAEERQLAGICMTDHNTMSGYDEVSNTPLAVVKGIEWTTYFGHMLVQDCKEFVDWRDAVPDNIDEKMTQVHAQDGLVGIAHPFQLGTPICTGGHWDYNIKDFSLVNYMEVWSEGSPFMNCSNKRAKKMWHSLLDKGFHIAPTFGRDWHRTAGNKCISACTYLLCEGELLTKEKMKAAIKGGRTVLSLGPEFIFETEDGNTIGDEISAGEHTLSFRIDDRRAKAVNPDESIEPETIRIVTNGGEVVAEFPATQEEIPINFEANHWYNAELYGRYNAQENCLIALTAAIYVK